jgi:hypothetical protein
MTDDRDPLDDLEEGRLKADVLGAVVMAALVLLVVAVIWQVNS